MTPDSERVTSALAATRQSNVVNVTQSVNHLSRRPPKCLLSDPILSQARTDGSSSLMEVSRNLRSANKLPLVDSTRPVLTILLPPPLSVPSLALSSPKCFCALPLARSIDPFRSFPTSFRSFSKHSSSVRRVCFSLSPLEKRAD